MKHGVGLFFLLATLWLLASGIYDHTLLFILGFLSCLGVVVLSHRMKILDEEAVPLHLTGRGLKYLPWLAWEVVKANWDVARRVIVPNMPISPTVVKLNPTQKTDLCRVYYANSITLTPGTVSIEAEGGDITVHAITREAAQALVDGEMDRRVTRMEGST